MSENNNLSLTSKQICSLVNLSILAISDLEIFGIFLINLEKSI